MNRKKKSKLRQNYVCVSVCKPKERKNMILFAFFFSHHRVCITNELM